MVAPSAEPHGEQAGVKKETETKLVHIIFHAKWLMQFLVDIFSYVIKMLLFEDPAVKVHA